MATTYEQLSKQHPCFAKGGMGQTGRIHLPTSPTCNIECSFCDRKINKYEKRPGVSATVISPEETIEVIRRSLELCPELTVAGIAGPGDTLASDFALQSFRLIGKQYPKIFKCMSTNGLLLPERAEEIIEVGIDSLTVTVNAVDPKIEAQLNRGILYHGVHIKGEEAAKILIENQLKGIRLIADAGITVKVNTVLVPRINGEHIGEIAKAVKEAGAKIYNIIPLIPQHDLKDEPAPDCKDLFKARLQAEKYIDVFRHCQRCRADAIGVPGKKDVSEQVYQRKLQIEETFSHG